MNIPPPRPATLARPRTRPPCSATQPPQPPPRHPPTCDTCTPRPRWMLAQRMHRNTPRLAAAQEGRLPVSSPLAPLPPPAAAAASADMTWQSAHTLLPGLVCCSAASRCAYSTACCLVTDALLLRGTPGAAGGAGAAGEGGAAVAGAARRAGEGAVPSLASACVQLWACAGLSVRSASVRQCVDVLLLQFSKPPCCCIYLITLRKSTLCMKQPNAAHPISPTARLPHLLSSADASVTTAPACGLERARHPLLKVAGGTVSQRGARPAHPGQGGSGKRGEVHEM